MRFSLRQLQVFLAIAHSQNVSRAAETLAMSQSATSGALQDLEKQFDIQLFDRVGKRLQINELGERLRPRAQALMQQAEELEEELLQHQQAGHLRIGATLTIGNYLCVDLIRHFMARWPNSRLNLEVNNTAHITREILNFDIDMGMIEGEFHHPDLDILPWQTDCLTCFCAPEHPLAAIGELTEATFCNYPWILREAGSGTRQTFDRAVGPRLHNLPIQLELQHTEAIKRAVESGMGISCLSEITLADAFKRGSLVPVKTPFLNLGRQLYLVIHKQKYRSAGLLNWLDVCKTFSKDVQ